MLKHMKKIIPVVIALLCVFATVHRTDAQELPQELNASSGTIRVHLAYPHLAKVDETVLIKSSIAPKDFASRNAISVKISSKTNPESDYSYLGGYPNARVTFYKSGRYALTVSTGLLVSDG